MPVCIRTHQEALWPRRWSIVDDEALAEAAKVRAAAVARMRAMVAEGEVDFSLIEGDGARSVGS